MIGLITTHIEKFIAIQKRIGYKRRIPDQFEHLYGGSNWMSITYECAKHITENKRKYRRFYNRLKYTFAADEVYFHTVILNSIFANKVESTLHSMGRKRFSNHS